MQGRIGGLNHGRQGFGQVGGEKVEESAPLILVSSVPFIFTISYELHLPTQDRGLPHVIEEKTETGEARASLTLSTSGRNWLQILVHPVSVLPLGPG